jgi:pilus assembly protein CpaB
LLVGGIAAYFTNQYIDDRRQAFKTELRSQYELVPVVVPRRDLEAGERIQKRDMLVRELPKKFLDDNTVVPGQFDEYSGQKLRVPVDRGTPLLTSFAGKPGSTVGASFSRSVPKDMRALTIPVSGTSAVAGLLVPGDHIDMYLQTSGPKGKVLLPLLGDVELLATGSRVGRASSSADQSQRSYRSVTVKVAPEQARKIKEGQELGSLVVMLRNPGDRSDMTRQAMTPKDVFDGRYEDLLSQQGRRQPEQENGNSVEVIQGANGATNRSSRAAGAGQPSEAQRRAMREAAKRLRSAGGGGAQ